jgi:fatty-acyl-CoA synthase
MTADRLPWDGAHWVDHVARHAHATPDRVAIRFEGQSLTWAGLDDRIRRVAAGLHAQGIRKGDRVAILMLNRPEFVESTLAANAIGAIAVPVNFRLAPEEAAYVLGHSDARVLVTDAPLAGLAAAAVRAAGTSTSIVTVGIPDGTEGAFIGFDELLAGAAEAPVVDIDERDVALIMYTSGTTGRPKGAMLTHLNLLMQSFTAIRTSRLYGDDNVALVNVPLFHIAGIGSMPPSLMLGSRIVIMATKPFDAQSTLDVVESEGVTGLFLVPAQWQALCRHPQATERCRSLRTISWGAAPATVTLLEEMARTFPHVDILSVFGQTEMSPVTTYLPSEDAVRKIGSVGKPVPTISARVVDDDMKDVPPGAVGEIVYRGPTLMAGYWNDPAATADAFGGGWFHSGDLVRADEDGFLYVVDRKKDMIISGGENIYPAEVENVLMSHPAVADCAVIGVPDQKWGETPKAIVVLDGQATERELIDFCRSKLAHFKCPTSVEWIDVIPRNPTGKVLKRGLREPYWKDHSRAVH